MDRTQPTKSSRILALARLGLNSKQIAEEIYPGSTAREIAVRMSYVRVVVRQRAGASLSVFDRAYLKRTREDRNKRKRERYHSDAEFRARTIKTNKAWTIRRNAARKAWLTENRPQR